MPKPVEYANSKLNEIDGVVAWWKKLATKRYNKMIAENKVRTELEVWNQDTMDKIDIIR